MKSRELVVVVTLLALTVAAQVPHKTKVIAGAERVFEKAAKTNETDNAYIKLRPSMKMPLQPLYKDHFAAQGFVVWVTRDAAGKIDKLHVGASRMRDLRFDRKK